MFDGKIIVCQSSEVADNTKTIHFCEWSSMSKKSESWTTFSVYAHKYVCYRIESQSVGWRTELSDFGTIQPLYKSVKLLHKTIPVEALSLEPHRSRTICSFLVSSIFGRNTREVFKTTPKRQNHWQFPTFNSRINSGTSPETMKLVRVPEPLKNWYGRIKLSTVPFNQDHLERSVIGTLANAAPESSRCFKIHEHQQDRVQHSVYICLPNGSIRGKSSAASVGITMSSNTSVDIRKCGDLCCKWCCNCSSMQL